MLTFDQLTAHLIANIHTVLMELLWTLFTNTCTSVTMNTEISLRDTDVEKTAYSIICNGRSIIMGNFWFTRSYWSTF